MHEPKFRQWRRFGAAVAVGAALACPAAADDLSPVRWQVDVIHGDGTGYHVEAAASLHADFEAGELLVFEDGETHTITLGRESAITIRGTEGK